MPMPESSDEQRLEALRLAWEAAEQAKAFQDLVQTTQAHAEAVIAQAWAAIAAAAARPT